LEQGHGYERVRARARVGVMVRIKFRFRAGLVSDSESLLGLGSDLKLVPALW